MSLTRAGFTSMSRASRFWLMPFGFMNSSARISPGGLGSELALPSASLSDNRRSQTLSAPPSRHTKQMGHCALIRIDCCPASDRLSRRVQPSCREVSASRSTRRRRSGRSRRRASLLARMGMTSAYASSGKLERIIGAVKHYSSSIYGNPSLRGDTSVVPVGAPLRLRRRPTRARHRRYFTPFRAPPFGISRFRHSPGFSNSPAQRPRRASRASRSAAA